MEMMLSSQITGIREPSIQAIPTTISSLRIRFLSVRRSTDSLCLDSSVSADPSHIFCL
jgi:hypothetical protein